MTFDYFCHTCGRKIFISDSEDVLRSRGYCSPWCQANATNSRRETNEARNDLWFWMTQTGRTAIYVAKMADVNPAQVYKAIKSRKEEAGI